MLVAKWGLPMAGACIGERYLTSYICDAYSVSAVSPAFGECSQVKWIHGYS
eukprot:SAG31_NODE_4395_length_3271_cov_3.996217_5_plen_51_part_00